MHQIKQTDLHECSNAPQTCKKAKREDTNFKNEKMNFLPIKGGERERELFGIKHVRGFKEGGGSGVLERYLGMGISCNSRFIHKYSPKKAITASPVPFTTHHVTDEGQPPYAMHIKRWIM